MSQTLDHLSPHSLDAEKSILGAVLLHEEALHEAVGAVQSMDFFRDAHKQIFAAMVSLQERRVAIDFTTLTDELIRRGELDAVGGKAYLSALVDGMPRSANIEHYAKIVSEKARLRRLIAAGNKLVNEAYAAEEDATDILERAEQVILGLADGTVQTGFESMRTVAPRALALLERIQSARGGVTGVASGFADLDRITRGLQPGTLVVVGARPGVGKTSLASNIAYHAAEQGTSVGFFSLEMPSEELFLRQVAAATRIDSHRIQGGYLSDREWARVSEAIGRIAEMSVYIDETPAIKIFAVRSRARRLKAERHLGLLVIDYLQLMETPSGENRATAIGVITAALKSLAKELKIPIVLLSQLNRDSIKGERPRKPQLSDLRESGSIEQDADIVMLLHRGDVEAEPDLTELIIAKHRNGAIGTIKLRWSEQFTRFDNYIADEAPADRRLPMGDR